MVVLLSHRNKFCATRVSEGGSCVWNIKEVATDQPVGVYKNHEIEFCVVRLTALSLVEIHDLILSIRRHELA